VVVVVGLLKNKADLNIAELLEFSLEYEFLKQFKNNKLSLYFGILEASYYFKIPKY